MYADFRAAYSSPSVLQWSVWWAFATCGNLQVGNYAQPLWEEIAPWEDFDSEGALYNGLVEASNTLLGTQNRFMCLQGLRKLPSCLAVNC